MWPLRIRNSDLLYLFKCSFNSEHKRVGMALIHPAHFLTWVPDKNDTSATQATRVQQSATWALQERRECYTYSTSEIPVKKFDFDNNTSENIFSLNYISYIAYESLQGLEKFHSKNYFLEIPPFHAKIEKWMTKTKLCKGKSSIKKLYTKL